MNPQLKSALLAHERAVPRYTSYPTAPHFRDGFEPAHYAAWLQGLKAENTLSLYVHVPFCPRMCWFCGCNTKIVNTPEPVSHYLELLNREIDLLLDLDIAGSMRHLHFGGGSPTIVNPPAMSDLILRLRTGFHAAPDAEIAIEIDPRQLHESHVASYARAGVNRASLGVQDFDEKVMKAVNRPQPFHASYNAARLCRSYGIDNINIDLMYGLPHQTIETMKRTIDLAMLLAPDRIALFGYAHVPWMKKHMQLMPEDALPGASARLELFEVASALLQDAGYRAIGIDHFARPDDPLALAQKTHALRRNFQGYTTDISDALIGIGPSAIGRLPLGFVQNAPDMPRYRNHLAAGRLPVEKGRLLTAEDCLHADIIERLMCDLQADVASLCAKHGVSIDDLQPCLGRLRSLERDGLVSVTRHGFVRVHARQAARLAAAAFDLYLQTAADKAPRHSTAA